MNFNTSFPELVDLEIIGQSYQGRNITCLRITNELDTRQKAKTLVVAHHHGREQITIEMALRFILWLLNNYGVDAIVTNYINTQEIYIIPSLNPDTLEYVINQGNHWLRKNLRPYNDDGDGLVDEDSVDDVNGDGIISGFDVYSKSGGNLVYEYTYYEGIDNDADGETNEDPVGLVDLNRNYATGFGNPGSSSDSAAQTYHGPAPFSELETGAFMNFTLKHRFAMAFSLHSGINATYFPSFQGGGWVEPSLYTQIFNELDDLLPPWYNGDAGFTSEKHRGVISLLETGESGFWQDWMYAERNTVVPICFEVYNNASSLSDDAIKIIIDNEFTRIEEWTGIYGLFNPVAAYIDNLWTELQPAFDYLLSLTPCLDVSLQSALLQGNSLVISVNLHCISPSLSTIDSIEFIAEDGTILYTSPAIPANQIVPVSATFLLSGVGPSNTIRIGNNYTGYVSLYLLGVPAQNLIPIIAGFTISIVAIVIMVLLIRRSRR